MNRTKTPPTYLWSTIVLLLLVAFQGRSFAFQTLPSSLIRSSIATPASPVAFESIQYSSHRHSHTIISSAVDPNDAISLESANPSFLAFAALLLGLLANGWIQSMISGDQGLGNFLSDGSGFGKSKFRPLSDSDRATSTDPLPWLRLPELDFVEVAGQPKSSGNDPVLTQLEGLRQQLNERLDQGDQKGAERIRDEMERMMSDNAITFFKDET